MRIFRRHRLSRSGVPRGSRPPLLLATIVRVLITGLCCALFRTSYAAEGSTAPEPNASFADTAEIAKPETAAQSAEPEPWNVHGQLTFVKQYHPSFTSPYQGANSLTPGRNGEETTDATLFLGVRLWHGAAFYVNPEIDQGFGLSDTLGVAGFPSGAAYKVGQSKPYFRLQRAFLRQRFDLGGEMQTIAPGANELGGAQAVDNVTVTAGKFSVTDIFDTNTYAHDPRGDFLNWAIIDAAPFDYAADAWGYTVGVAIEWSQSWWTLRGGFFDLSNVPNSKALEPGFKEFALIGEAEGRGEMAGHPGKVKWLAFFNYGRMGSYSDAVALGQVTATTPDTANVRRYASRWNRAQDTIGIAAAFNDISGNARSYFAAGGLGILIGDGQLPHPGWERIVESYYAWQLAEHFTVTADYQYVVNPAYNRDRGPVSILGLRLHAEF